MLNVDNMDMIYIMNMVDIKGRMTGWYVHLMNMSLFTYIFHHQILITSMSTNQSINLSIYIYLYTYNIYQLNQTTIRKQIQLHYKFVFNSKYIHLIFMNNNLIQ